MPTRKTQPKKKTELINPQNYIVIEYQNGVILSFGKKTIEEIDKIQTGVSVTINGTANTYVVENMKYYADIKLYVIFVTEDTPLITL